MSRLNSLLNWFRPAPTDDDFKLRRLDGLKGYLDAESDPKVKVFAHRPGRPTAAA